MHRKIRTIVTEPRLKGAVGRNACLVVPFFLASLTAIAANKDLRAGVARIDITPEGPIWMTGYGNRTHPSTGVAQHIWAKALAIVDSQKNTVVIVTTDLVGLPRSITDLVAARVQKAHGLERGRLLFNSSHTHAGPLVQGNLPTMFDLPPEDAARVAEYARKLTDNLFNVISAALGDLAPAKISYGSGSAGFAMNRRHSTAKGVEIGVNTSGPVDHSVPVLRVTSPDGKLRAILFAYACHGTTLTGDFYEIDGDYAGYAQQDLEKSHPGATALFMLLCAGDQNPNPRGTLALTEQHGKTLADEVSRLIQGDMTPIRGPIRTAYVVTDLQFAPHDRETYEQELRSSNPAAVRRAQKMLKAFTERLPVRRTSYPVQAIRFDHDLTILALGGEVVVGYDLRAKREFPNEPLIVAGYSNDVMCYIPTRQMLSEGGYEVNDSMIYYGQPGPFADDVEERVFAAIGQVAKKVGLKRK